MSRVPRPTALAWLLPLLISCGGPEPAREALPPRAVSAIVLKEVDPGRRDLLTGSVASWKQEDIGFEVTGRVEYVIDTNTDVEGHSVDEKDEIISEGDVIARLDPTQYELRLRAGQAQLAAREAESEATRIQIERVLAEDLIAAEAERDRAVREHDRLLAVAKEGVGTQADLDRAESAAKVAEAKVDQADAAIAAKKAALQAIEAQVEQTRVSVNQAKIDLENCTLVAPFTGRVSQVHVIPGGYVQPGRAVVTLVMMDPVKVEISLSAETDRALARGTPVLVYPPGEASPVEAWVFRKQTVADPATRTYTTHIMVRNRRVLSGGVRPEDVEGLPRIEEVWHPQVIDVSRAEGLYVDLRSLEEDEEGFFVWRAENPGPGDGPLMTAPIVVVRKVRVTPGEQRVSVLGLYLFRKLADPGEIRIDDLIACVVPEGVKDGDRVFVAREQWLFRPGDLVQVSLRPRPMPRGFYVPMEAILEEEGSHFVYIAAPTPEGADRADKVEVTLHEDVGELRRIEADTLAAGTRIVLSGVHYLIPGERIRVVEEVSTTR